MTNIVCTVSSGFTYDAPTNTCTSNGGPPPPPPPGPIVPPPSPVVLPGPVEISAEPLKIISIQHNDNMLNKLEVFFDEQPQNIEFNTDIEITQDSNNLVFTSDANNNDKKLILTTSKDFEINKKIDVFFKKVKSVPIENKIK